MKNKRSIVMCTSAILMWSGSVFAKDAHEKYQKFSQMLMSAKVTPLMALQKVQEKYAEGVIIEYELDAKKGELAYQVDVVLLDKKVKYKISLDAQSGEILKEEPKDLTNRFKQSKDIVEAEKINQSGVSLKDSINILNLKEGKLVEEIEFESKNGIEYFEIETLSSKGKEKWLVDIQSKEVIPKFQQMKKE